MAMKTLFPPIVPSNLPAFDGSKGLRYYFKPSSANTMNQVQHLQMVIVRLDTNRSALNQSKYPLDIIFKKKSEIQYDEAKMYYYVDIQAEDFPMSDVVYKVQIRLGEDDISDKIDSSEKLGAWLKDPLTLNKLSEWSIVTYALPIVKPDFGIQSFETGKENMVDSTGYKFVGYYEAKDKDRAEVLSSYIFNLYTFEAAEDPKTWKLLSTSGEKKIGQYEKDSISHAFNYELIEESSYIVTMSIKSKNLYTETKTYRIRSASYPVLEMFNSIDISPNVDEAKMDITVRAKQVLMRPQGGTKVTYIKDDIGNESYPNLKGTHAIIDGKVSSGENDFILNSINGKWICQLKAMVTKVHDSAKDAIDNAFVVLDNVNPYSEGLSTKLSIGAMKINMAYPTNTNLSPSPIWEYRFIIKKEVYTDRGISILTQNRVIRQSEPIDPKQEYYFFIEEINGSIVAKVQKTYKSTKS